MNTMGCCLCGIVTVMLSCCSLSHAADIPTMDTRSFCEKMAKVVRLPEESMRSAYVPACELVEGVARDRMDRKWGFIPPQISDRCVRVSAMFGYEMLNKCLDDALQGWPLPSGVSSSFMLNEGGHDLRRFWTHGECIGY